jgi:sensor domain CHASE-containing protein
MKKWLHGITGKFVMVNSIILIGVFGLFIVYVFSYLRSNFGLLEEREGKINVSRVQFTFNESIKNLEKKMSDWSIWDDSYNFVQDKNKNFIDSNLTVSMFSTLELNLISFINNKNEIVFLSIADFKNERILPLDDETKNFIRDNKFLYENLQGDKILSGLIYFKGDPHLITSRPIFKSDRSGPSMGRVIAATKVDANFIKNLSQQTQLNLNFYQLDKNINLEKEKREKNKSVLDEIKNTKNFITDQQLKNQLHTKDYESNAYFIIKDMFDHPIILGEVKMSREIYQLGQISTYSMLVGSLIVFLVVMCTVSILVHRLVLKRIFFINKEFENFRFQNNFKIRFLEDGRDEITLLQKEINQTLENLDEKSRSFNILLDNVNDAIFYFDKTGAIGERYSKSCLSFFPHQTNLMGIKNIPSNVKEFLFEENSNVDAILPVIFNSTTSFDVAKQLLPKRLVLEEGKILEVNYIPIYQIQQKAKSLQHILIVAKDMTRALELENNQLKIHQLNESIIRIIKNKDEFHYLVEDIRQLVEVELDREQLRIEIHTIKGTLGFFSLNNLFQICHDIESMTDESQMKIGVRKLVDQLNIFMLENEAHLSQESTRTIKVSSDKFSNYYNEQSWPNLNPFIRKTITDIFFVPINERLSWLNNLLLRRAEKVKKKVYPIQYFDLEKAPQISPIGYEDLIRSFVHIIYNFLDHGLEYPNERAKKGLDPAGTLSITFSEMDDIYKIRFSDNGRGLNKEVILKKALENSLVKNLNEELTIEIIEKLIFKDGFSTSQSVTETSGRGIGLGAIKSFAEKLGGSTHIIYDPNSTLKGFMMDVTFKKVILKHQSGTNEQIATLTETAKKILVA